MFNCLESTSLRGSCCFVASFILAVGLPLSVAQADILYGSTGGDNGSGGGRIYKIDTAAQTVTPVGNTGFDRTGGLVFDATGRLLVVSGGSAGPGTLLAFDVGSGMTSVIGPVTGVQGVDALEIDSNGTLWGAAWTGIQGALVKIDPATGAVLSQLLLNGSGNSFCAGLAFHSGGRLYASRGNAAGRQDDVVILDPGTGNHNPIGAMEAVISDLAFGASGTLYGSATNGIIYEIDPSSGVKRFLFNTGISSLSGLTADTANPPCYPDCDTSTGVGVLDIFDFLCFGNRFASGDPYACDCDLSTGPGVCDIFDFLCFGNAFSAGCP